MYGILSGMKYLLFYICVDLTSIEHFILEVIVLNI